MKYNANKTRVRALCAVLLLAAFVGGSASSAFMAQATASPSGAASHRARAEAARKKATQADAQAKKLAKEIADLDGDAERYAKQATALAPKIETASEKNQRLSKEVHDLQAQANQLAANIKATQAEFDHQQELLGASANTTYRRGDEALIQLVFNAQDWTDFITRSEYALRIMSENSRLSQELTRLTRELQTDKTQLDTTLGEAKKKQKAAAAEHELRDLQTQRKNAAVGAETLQNKKNSLLKDTKKNAARLRALAEEEEAQARQLEGELAGTGSGVYHGKMTWPTPGHHRITSSFGWRICPFHGREMHPGIDIAGAAAGSINGAAIVAAGSGTVISAGYRGGYGYTVIIDHGNGVTTLYAHQQAGGIKVANGTKVEAGQRIGTVGSTGSSTGPHLHWEVRVNGVAKNPLSY
jgi:murein DD-endopeptidase MepM/ murein hydrolase activator NlpD